MRVVVQRSKYASCKVDNKITGKIDLGYMLLVGFKEVDTLDEINLLAKKVVGLRIFSDNEGKMNLSIKDVNGAILAISQFTLYADTKKGNRPSYIKALNGSEAIKLYDEFNSKLNEFVNTLPGVFGADMKVSLINDGPVTIIIDSKEK